MPSLRNILQNRISVGLICVAFGMGCDKGQSTAPGTPAGPSAQAPTAGIPAAASVALSAAAMTELAGTYSAVSDAGDGSPLKRHQSLILKADGTVELDTTVMDPGKPAAAPHSSDHATGTYTAGAKEVVATFTIKDGKPIPASDTKHVMKLTREKGDKSLTDEAGRTFDRAK